MERTKATAYWEIRFEEILVLQAGVLLTSEISEHVNKEEKKLTPTSSQRFTCVLRQWCEKRRSDLRLRLVRLFLLLLFVCVFFKEIPCPFSQIDPHTTTLVHTQR